LDYKIINNNFMAIENDVTKKISGLEENKDVAGLEELKADAEAGFDGETVGLVEKAISRLNTKVEEVIPLVETTEGQKIQVENMGGSESALNETTAPIDAKIASKDQEIKNVEAETEQKIKEIQTEKAVNPELQKELEHAKKNEEYWSQKRNEVELKQGELVNYDQYIEFAKIKLDKVSEYEAKYENILDEEIITFPNTEKHSNERIAFKGLSENKNRDLIYEKQIGELVVDVMQAYSFDEGRNENPQRIFGAKKETTLRKLLAEYKTFLQNQLAIPKPTQAQIDANQTEVNMVWDSYKKSQEEVKNIESKIV